MARSEQLLRVILREMWTRDSLNVTAGGRGRESRMDRQTDCICRHRQWESVSEIKALGEMLWAELWPPKGRPVWNVGMGPHLE